MIGQRVYGYDSQQYGNVHKRKGGKEETVKDTTDECPLLDDKLTVLFEEYNVTHESHLLAYHH